VATWHSSKWADTQANKSPVDGKINHRLTEKQMIDRPIETRIPRLFEIASRVTFLTGAGVSAESGIPTFRGPEGYWRIGSVNYQLSDMALTTPRGFFWECTSSDALSKIVGLLET